MKCKMGQMGPVTYREQTVGSKELNVECRLYCIHYSAGLSEDIRKNTLAFFTDHQISR